LLKVFAGLVPRGHTVIVMTDRALYARWLYPALVSLGWHPVMRITQLSKFRKGRSKNSLPVTALVPRPGTHWQGQGVAFPKKPERRWECTLLACWEPGYEGPWFLVTDLAADQAESLWYGMRSWIEGGSKLLKSGGWQWPATRRTDAARVERLWLVLAVATCDLRAMGGEADAEVFAAATVPEPVSPSAPAAPGPEPASRGSGKARRRRPGASASPTAARRPRQRRTGTKERWVSVFRQGLAVLVSLLIAGHALPKPCWKPEAWLELRCGITASQQPQTPIPKNPSQ
jgi:hypothetical protein